MYGGLEINHGWDTDFGDGNCVKCLDCADTDSVYPQGQHQIGTFSRKENQGHRMCTTLAPCQVRLIEVASSVGPAFWVWS